MMRTAFIGIQVAILLGLAVAGAHSVAGTTAVAPIKTPINTPGVYLDR